jgi:hypothetical protein
MSKATKIIEQLDSIGLAPAPPVPPEAGLVNPLSYYTYDIRRLQIIDGPSDLGTIKKEHDFTGPDQKGVLFHDQKSGKFYDYDLKSDTKAGVPANINAPALDSPIAPVKIM